MASKAYLAGLMAKKGPGGTNQVRNHARWADGKKRVTPTIGLARATVCLTHLIPGSEEFYVGGGCRRLDIPDPTSLVSIILLFNYLSSVLPDFIQKFLNIVRNIDLFSLRTDRWITPGANDTAFFLFLVCKVLIHYPNFFWFL